MSKIRILYYEIVGIFFALCYSILTPGMRRIFTPVFEKIYICLQSSIRFALQIRLESYYIVGNCDSAKIKIFYIGHNPHFSYLIQETGIDNVSIKYVGKIFLWNIQKRTRECGTVDMIILETNKLIGTKLQRRGFFLIPEWVNFMLPVPHSMQDYRKSYRGRKIREDIRRFRKYDYSHEITRNEDKLHFFYYQMYVPYIQKRIGHLAYLHDYSFFKRLLKSGTVHLVKHENNYIAGQFFIFRNSTLWVKWFGMTKGSEIYRKRVVNSAAKYFTIEWAIEHNFKTIDFGLCRAFLKDGLFRYKRKWGMILNIDSMNTRFFGLKVCRLNNGTKNFLKKNPFIFHGEKGLEGLVCVEKELITQEELRKISRNFQTDGLQNLTVLCFSDVLPELSQNIFHDSHNLHIVTSDFLFQGAM